MLPAEEETLVLLRAVHQGELVESEIPSAAGSGPPGSVGETLRFGKQLDRLISRGRISEKRVLAILRKVRAESLGRGATVLPNRGPVRRDLGLDVTVLPNTPSYMDEIVSSVPVFSEAVVDENGCDQTVDGSQVGYKGPQVVREVRFPVENWERYTFEKLLGQGGMGAVFKARDNRLGRQVALKFIRGGDEQMTHRFLQEARAQSRLDHPGICHVLEVGEVEGKAYITMQFVDGESLDKAGRGMTLFEKVQAIRDVCLAMHHAHEKGVIHRDLKPSNIMVEKRSDGSFSPIVMDFGLAREAGEGRGLTESGAVIGTPAFMSPEQARGEARHLDRRSDVYSLGATLFDVLSGQAPFEDETVVGIMMSVMTREAPLLRSVVPTLPEALETICARCLTKDKEQRYPTAQALADDLSRFLNSEKIVAKKVSLLYRLMWRARQNKPAAALVVSLFVLGVVSAGYGARQSYVARKQADLQRQIAQDSKDIEWLIRTAHALPLHNVEREQQNVRKRMQQVGHKLGEYGELAAGLGHYALGRGHLSLHDYKKAREHLEQAHKLGEDGPELHAALGRTLGELYHEALLVARRSGEKSWVEKRQKELQAQLLQPATRSLQKALNRQHQLSLDSPFYIEGLLDFYSGREKDADWKAQLALLQMPWLAEAAKLRGEIAQALSLRDVMDGKLEQARTHLLQAIGHYEQAADISRSDGLIAAALARAYLDLADLDRLQGRPPSDHFAAAQTAAEKAITSLPSDATGYLEKARGLFFMGKSIQIKVNKLETYNNGIETAQIALTKEPDNFLILDLLGNLFNYRGYVERSKNRDPEQSFEKAKQALTEAIKRAPNSPWVHNDLGALFANWGNVYLESGRDPRELYQRAIDSVRRAVEIDGKYLFAYNTLVTTLAQYSDFGLNHGERFDSIMRIADETTQRCGTGCTSYVFFQRNMAVLWLNYSLHLLERGDDPTTAVSTARGYLNRQRHLDKNMYSLCLSSRYADFVESAWLTKQLRDPSKTVDRALADLETCKRFDAKAQEPHMLAARFHLLKASYYAAQKQPFVDLLMAARASATLAVELDDQSTDSWIEKARVEERWAFTQTGAARKVSLEQGLWAVEQGLKADANAGRLWAIRAVLKNEQARDETDPAATAKLRDEARKSWAKALAQNPLLQNEYGDRAQLPAD